jgi:hypothetical protein
MAVALYVDTEPTNKSLEMAAATGAGVTNNLIAMGGSNIVSKLAGKVVEAKLGGGLPTSQPKPPPTVWCVKLRRKPVLTEEDKPEITDGEKLCWKILVVPPSFCLYLFGSLLWAIIMCFSCVLAPMLGQGFLIMLREKSKEGRDISRDVKQGAAQVACCGKCLISTMWFASRHCIYPFLAFWNW